MIIPTQISPANCTETDVFRQETITIFSLAAQRHPTLVLIFSQQQLFGFFYAVFARECLWSVFTKTYIILKFFLRYIAAESTCQICPFKHFSLVDNLLKTQAWHLCFLLDVGSNAAGNLRHLLAAFA